MQSYEIIIEVEADKQPIWYNIHVRVQNKIVFFNAWYNAGIITIGDLNDPEGKIISDDQFSGSDLTLFSAIPFTWKIVQRATSMATPPILDQLCSS